MEAQPATWFIREMQASMEGILWGFRELPPERIYAAPPSRLGEWPAARHAFHLLYYERGVALPSIRHWLGEPYPTFEGYNEQAVWGDGMPLAQTLAELAEVRAGIYAALAEASGSRWEEALDTSWGHQTLYWVAGKTYQHGVQHQSDLLRILMLWDHYASRVTK